MVTEVPAGAPFQLVAGPACLELVNTVDRSTRHPWVENLTDYATLCRWSALVGTLPAARAGRLARLAARHPGQAEQVLGRARALREACFRVFEALARDAEPGPEDLTALNAELGTALAHARLERRGRGFAWTFEQAPESLEEPLWPLARSAAELLVSPELARVRRCASTTCLWLFLDTTRNRQRRWCDMKVCGNRAKVRAHRRRAAARVRRPRG